MGFVALVNAVKFNFGCCVAQLLPPGPFGFSVVISTLKGSFKTSFTREAPGAIHFNRLQRVAFSSRNVESVLV